jgi:hypothetical protein
MDQRSLRGRIDSGVWTEAGEDSDDEEGAEIAEKEEGGVEAESFLTGVEEVGEEGEAAEVEEGE